MVFSMVVWPQFSGASSDEGPTVIIVGSEQNKKETVNQQDPENQVPYPQEESNPVEESSDGIPAEIENPDQQHIEEYEEGSQGSQN